MLYERCGRSKNKDCGDTWFRVERSGMHCTHIQKTAYIHGFVLPIAPLAPLYTYRALMSVMRSMVLKNGAKFNLPMNIFLSLIAFINIAEDNVFLADCQL